VDDSVEDGADEAGAGSRPVQNDPAEGEHTQLDGSGRHARSWGPLDRSGEQVEATPAPAEGEPGSSAEVEPDAWRPRSLEPTDEHAVRQAPFIERAQVPAVAVPGVADWIGAPLPGDVLDESSLVVTTRSGGGSREDHARADDAPSPSLGAADAPGWGSPAADATPEMTVETTTEEVAVDAESTHAGASTSAPNGELGPVTGAWFAELAVSDISPNPRQPREVFDEESMAELVQSIVEVGLLQPIVVRPAVDGRYELVMGERRWRATEQAGLETIPAIVRETGDDALLRDALLENLHRSQLNALEEAAAYQQLLEDFGCTHDELATRIGRSRPQISNTIRLLKLSPAVQRRVAAGVLSAGHARALLGVESAEVQDRLASRVVAEGISVRGLEEIVAVDAGSATVRARRSRPTAPGVEDLAARLSDLLETRVRVDLGKRKGRITVEFASLPDLERIVGLIDPGHPGRTRQADQ
jgi:ParB family chromosome partitioning protein